MLRALQLGISVRDLDALTIGLVIDLYIEQGNDHADEDDSGVVAGQDEFDAF